MKVFDVAFNPNRMLLVGGNRIFVKEFLNAPAIERTGP